MLNSQVIATRTNGITLASERYVTNSPGNLITNSRVVERMQDSASYRNTSDSIILLSIRSSLNHGNPGNVIFTDALGLLRVGPVSGLAITSGQVTDALTFTPYNATNPNGYVANLSTFTTTNLSEGTNLYYTAARFNTAFAAKSTTDLAEGTNLYFTNARSRAALSLTTNGTSGATTYNNSTGVLNVPVYSSAPTFSQPSRSLSTTGSNNTFTISSTLPARVYYTINFTYALTLTTSNGQVDLDYSLNGGSTWVNVTSVSNVYSLAVTLSGNTNSVLSGEVPANALVRINRVSNSNSTVSIVSLKQLEVTYN